MFKRYLLGLLFAPPDTGAGSGGTTDNSAASSSGGASTGATSSGNVTSGTASEAMIKAAMASSSEAPATSGADGVTKPAGAAGDTTQHGPIKADEAATPDATAQGAAKVTSDATDKPGFIPLDRHQASLANVRRDTTAAIRKEYGNLEPKRAVAAFKLASRVAADPAKFYQELGDSLKARGLLKPTAQPQTLEDLEPALRSEDGKQTAYSADQVRKLLSTQVEQATQKLMGDLRPMLEFYGSESERRAGEEAQGQARSTAASALKEARDLPFFKENEAAIGEALLAMDPEIRSQLGPIGAMYRAYNLILAKSVLPGVDKSAEERVRASFAKKAASTEGSVHPGGSTGGDGKKPSLNNVSDLAKHMEALAGVSV